MVFSVFDCTNCCFHYRNCCWISFKNQFNILKNLGFHPVLFRTRMTKNTSPFWDLYFFIQADRLGISSRFSVYIINSQSELYLITPLGVHKKLSAWWYTTVTPLMICNSLRNWWYTMLRIDSSPLLCYNTKRRWWYDYDSIYNICNVIHC